jgi:hypothetical protein
MNTKQASPAGSTTGKPKKGVMPRLDGVPGELVSLEDLALVLNFSSKKTRVSPYDPLLDQLAESGPGKVLKFCDVRARISLIARAKKKGLRLSFAESGTDLYVRCDGRPIEDVRASRRTAILKILNTGPHKLSRITAVLREAGDLAIDMSLALLILSQMEKAGEVIHQEGDQWAKSPRKASH